MKETADGNMVCLKVILKIKNKNAHDNQQIQMLVEIDERKMEKTIGYKHLCLLVEEQVKKSLREITKKKMISTGPFHRSWIIEVPIRLVTQTTMVED